MYECWVVDIRNRRYVVAHVALLITIFSATRRENRRSGSFNTCAALPDEAVNPRSYHTSVIYLLASVQAKEVGGAYKPPLS